MARTSLTEGSAEALIAGREDEVLEDLADVAAVLHAVRASAERPSVPTADLVDLFAGGAEPQPEPRPAPGPRTAGAGRRWVGATLRRVAPLGVAAKLGLVAVVGVGGVTGAGAAGTLPDGLQDRVADAVGTVTPFEFPTSADEHAEVGAEVSEHATDPEDPGVDGPAVADEVTPRDRIPAETRVPEPPARPDRGLGEAEDQPAEERVPGAADDPPTGAQVDPPTGAQADPPTGEQADPPTGEPISEEPPGGPETGEEHAEDPPAGPEAGDAHGNGPRHR